MSQEINYKVNAWLTTKGSFLDQMGQASRAAEDFSSKWSTAGQRFNEVGMRIAGTTGQMLGGLAKAGAVGLGAGLAGGLAGATAKGIAFNKLIEDSQLTTATMFQAFNMGANDVDVLAGKTSQFAANLERAAAMQGEIYSIAKESPGTFANINESYTMMASGLSGITKDLERQRNILEKSAVLVGLTEGDYKQLGSDVGRIAQGLAGMDVRTFAALQGPFGEAMAEVTKKQIPKDLAAAFNKLAPEERLKTLETVLNRIPPEVGQAFGKSFEGAVSTAESAMDQLAGGFSRPLFDSIKSTMVRLSGEGGMLGGKSLEKLEHAADFLGRKIAVAFERGVSFIERAVGFLTDNWQELWMRARAAAAVTATAIKIAFVAGLTRMVAGSIISGIGTAMRGAATAKAIATPIAAWIAKQSRATHVGIVRGSKGKGSGLTGLIGRGVGEVASGFESTRKAFAVMAREAKALPSLVATGLMLTKLAFDEAVSRAKGLPALARTGLAWVKTGFGVMVAKAKGLPAAVRRGIASVQSGFLRMSIAAHSAFGTAVAKARTLPAVIRTGFASTKKAFIQMAVQARAMGARGMLAAAGARARQAGSGMMGMMGRGRQRLGGALGRAGKGLGSLFGRGAAGGLSKLATAGTMLTAIAGPALILGVVLGGLAVAFGGIAAYITANWQKISSTLIAGLEQGKITLVPLMTSLYTLWMRLQMVGEALLGGGDATSKFNGILNMAITMIDFTSKGVGWLIKGLALMVGVLGALKLGIAGIVGVVAWVLEMLAKVPKVGAGLKDTANEMRASQASWMSGAQDTFTQSEKLGRAADKIMNAKLSPEDFAKAEAKGKQLEGKLKDFLEGAGKKDKKGPKVNVGTVNMNLNLEEPDPDRVMAMLVKPLMKMAGGRTQAYAATEEGN